MERTRPCQQVDVFALPAGGSEAFSQSDAANRLSAFAKPRIAKFMVGALLYMVWRGASNTRLTTGRLWQEWKAQALSGFRPSTKTETH